MLHHLWQLLANWCCPTRALRSIGRWGDRQLRRPVQ